MDYTEIQLGHGSGGRMTSQLLESVFLPAFSNPILNARDDQAVVSLPGGPLAFAADSFVVKPLFFPGGDIGDLAINGTVNDLAMGGAVPKYLSACFVLEEGLLVADLKRIVQSMAEAARRADVQVVTGDTKVVERGHGDGVYINTAGIGSVVVGRELSPCHVRPGDAIIVSGPLGEHGMAVMSCREGLEFETPIISDTAPLHELAARMLSVSDGIRCMRDPTRGGVASTLNEIADSAQVGMTIREAAIPISPPVAGLCEILGLDPLYVACEGRLVAMVCPTHAESVLQVMREHALGQQAAIVGEVVAEHPRTVVMRTSVGGTRIVDVMSGEQLPRIC